MESHSQSEQKQSSDVQAQLSSLDLSPNVHSEEAKEQSKSELSHNICIEIGSSRVKIGVQPITTPPTPFKFSQKPTQHFFLPFNQLTTKLSEHLTEEGVHTINRLSLSSTGEIGTLPGDEGIILSCGTLVRIAKLKYLSRFRIVDLLVLNSIESTPSTTTEQSEANSNTAKLLHGMPGLKQRVLQPNEVVLLNDGHSAGLGVLTWAKRMGMLASETESSERIAPSLLISLGTYPALGLLLDNEVVILNSRNLFFGPKHVSELCAKKLVLKGEITQEEFTQNILEKVIPLLQEACAAHLQKKIDPFHRIFIVGGMANYIIPTIVEANETLNSRIVLLPEDQYLYNEIIFPALSNYDQKLPSAIKLSSNSMLEVRI